MDNKREIDSIKIKDDGDNRLYAKAYVDFLNASPDLLSLEEKVLVIALKRFVDIRADLDGTTRGECFPSRDKLAKMLNVSPRTITYLTKSLVEKGVIRKIKRGLNLTNQYLLTDISDMWEAESVEELKVLASEDDEARALRIIKKKGYVLANGKIIPPTINIKEILVLPSEALDKDCLVSRDRKRIFVRVYMDFLDSGLLNITEIGLFITLKSFLDVNVDISGESACVFPSIDTLAERTGKTRKTVIKTLSSLNSKGVIQKERRGFGKPTNYILTDRASMWAAVDYHELKEAAKETELNRALKLLQKMGYVVEENENQSKKYDSSKNKPASYSKEFVQKMLNIKQAEKDGLIDDENRDMIHTCVGVIFDVLNSTQKTMRISGENKSIGVIKNVFLQLTMDQVLYAVDQYQKSTADVKYPARYMRSLLYDAGIGGYSLNKSKKVKNKESSPSALEKQLLRMSGLDIDDE